MASTSPSPIYTIKSRAIDRRTRTLRDDKKRDELGESEHRTNVRKEEKNTLGLWEKTFEEKRRTMAWT